MVFHFGYILLAIKVINVILHSIGFYALFSLYKNNQTVLLLFTCNLSFIEALRNVVGTLIVIIPVAVSLTESDNFHIFTTVILDVTNILHFGSMVCLTINRFCKIWLSENYRNICTTSRGKCALIIKWILSIIILVAFVVYYALNGPYDDSPFPYIFLSSGVSYIIIVTVTYSVLADQFRTSLTMRADLNESRLTTSLFDLFAKTRFYITDLLIACYLLITVIPDLAFMVISITSDSQTYRPTRLSTIPAPISDFVHAVIYIFFQHDTRRLFMESFYCRCVKYADFKSYSRFRRRTRHEGSKGAVFPIREDDFVIESSEC